MKLHLVKQTLTVIGVALFLISPAAGIILPGNIVWPPFGLEPRGIYWNGMWITDPDIVGMFYGDYGGTGSGGDPVDLCTGGHLYLPDPDITAYNPVGPEVIFQRNYHSKLVRIPYGSPGLAVGWVHNFDVGLVDAATAPGEWLPLKFVFPDGREEKISPVKDGLGNPTGEFTEPIGANFYATGVPSATAGRWESVAITWKVNQVSWVFTPTNAGDREVYAFTKIKNRMGRYVVI